VSNSAILVAAIAAMTTVVGFSNDVSFGMCAENVLGVGVSPRSEFLCERHSNQAGVMLRSP
jgi:hypothetical protein